MISNTTESHKLILTTTCFVADFRVDLIKHLLSF